VWCYWEDSGVAGALPAMRVAGDPKHGELARDERGGKTDGAQLLRRLLVARNALVSSADRDGHRSDGSELISGARARQWRCVVHG
jgi:hypothetical protein